MEIVQLPHEKLYVCNICGKSTTYEEGLRGCKERASVEKTSRQVGSTIHLYRKTYDKGVPVGISKEPEPWTIERIYYAQGHVPRMDMQFAPLSPHTLLFRLVKFTDPTSSVRDTQDLCARDLELWREGNETKLRRAGLVNHPEPSLREKIKRLLQI